LREGANTNHHPINISKCFKDFGLIFEVTEAIISNRSAEDTGGIGKKEG
jgi:hypothetical protein